MLFAQVDRIINQFLTALAAGDAAGVLAELADDAVLRYRDRSYRRGALARLLSTPGLRITASEVRRQGAGAGIELLLAGAVDGRGQMAAFRSALRLTLGDGRIVAVQAGRATPVGWPAPVAAFLGASNRARLERLLDTFADDAMVNDQLCDYWGKPAIAAWAARDVIGDRMRISVVKIAAHYGTTIITANIDGDYDQRGLPEPLVLAFHFSTWGEQIVQLIMLRNLTEL